MPKAIVTVREVKNKDTGIDISIPTHTETPGLFSSNIEFQVVVVTRLRCFKQPEHDDHDVVQFMVKKSQSDLEQLYAKMERNYPGTLFPALVRKSFLTEVPAIEHRVAFEKFLQFVSMTPKLCTCPVLLEFFGADPIKAGRYSRENSRQEAADAIDIFEEARNEQRPSPIRETRPVKRPSIFDDDEDPRQPPKDLFTADTGAEDDDDFDLLALAKAADHQAGAGPRTEGAEREEETGETDTARVTEPKLFGDLDFGGAMKKGDQSELILPGADQSQSISESTSLGAGLSDLALEDQQKLLEINDDIESIFKKSEPKPKPAAKPAPSAKPKPPTKPKPEIKPKPKLKPKTEIEISGSDDIMKYIRENTVDDNDVDLFS